MKLLFFISQNYSFEILRPVQELAIKRGYQVKWLVYLDRVNEDLFLDNEDFTKSAHEAVKFKPDAVLVPGNQVPKFLPGLKVEVFHGFEWKKKGHFRIRGSFDLYCTQGPFFTETFQRLADKHRYFDVIETGWPKLDGLHNSAPLSLANHNRPVILYAPTFSPSLTSTRELFSQIKVLSETQEHFWIVKFHPKTDPDIVRQYKELNSDNFLVLEEAAIGSVLQSADVMISDTSSIITEFMLLEKPVITFRNADPEACLVDIQNPEELSTALEKALNPEPELVAGIRKLAEQMHPYRDGQSSKRLLDAIVNTLASGKSNKKRLPLNMLRNLKMRKKMNYWRFNVK